MGERKDVDYRFKILYALGIIMVVCGHVQGGGQISIVGNWFPSSGVHLALFVFSSGYFYKQNSIECIGKYIGRKLKTLVFPLYIYTVVYGIIVQILKSKGFMMGQDITLSSILIMPIINGHQFIYNMGGWFIIPLFMVELYNILFRKLVIKLKLQVSESFYFITNIVLGVIGNQLACEGYLDQYWLVLVRMLYFIPFYGLGIFYRSVLEKYDCRISGIHYFGFIFLFKLIIIYIFGRSPEYTASWCNDFTDGPVMPIIIGYLGIAFWLRIATILEPAIGKNKYVNLIADNTYSIMMNQFLGFMIVKTIFALFNKYITLFQDFDWINYKTNIWWYYMPKGIMHIGILYVITGITFSIMVQKALDFLKSFIRKNNIGRGALNAIKAGMQTEGNDMM